MACEGQRQNHKACGCNPYSLDDCLGPAQMEEFSLERPYMFGGFGVHDLERMGQALFNRSWVSDIKAALTYNSKLAYNTILIPVLKLMGEGSQSTYTLQQPITGDI
ncbi:hypothetical protein ACJX0J_030534 [Zea mays]